MDHNHHVHGTVTVEIEFFDVPVRGLESDLWDTQVAKHVETELRNKLSGGNVRLRSVYPDTANYENASVSVPFERYDDVARILTPDGDS